MRIILVWSIVAVGAACLGSGKPSQISNSAGLGHDWPGSDSVACSPATDQPPASHPAPPPPPGPTARPPAPPQPTTRPTTQPATQPVAGEKPSSGDPVVDDILDRLETKGQAIKGLASQLTYRYVVVEPIEQEQVKEGELLFARAEPNSKFLIHFTKLTADGIPTPRGEYFLFDGEWLTERNDKARTIIRRQIVRPGERVDPFKLGQGPFPLPFGQKRADILSNFKVTLAPFELGDPRNTQHLHCVPRPHTELAQKYTRVEIYVDKSLELPVRVVTERIADASRIEVDFSGVNAGEAPAMSRFQIQQPGENLVDFSITEEALPALGSEGVKGVAP